MKSSKNSPAMSRLIGDAVERAGDRMPTKHICVSCNSDIYYGRPARHDSCANRSLDLAMILTTTITQNSDLFARYIELMENN